MGGAAKGECDLYPNRDCSRGKDRVLTMRSVYRWLNFDHIHLRQEWLQFACCAWWDDMEDGDYDVKRILGILERKALVKSVRLSSGCENKQRAR
jgi:hypothetical protein